MKLIETFVGLFIVAAVIALFVLAFKVSGISHLNRHNTYQVTADFDNIGNLKPRAAVTIAGVKIGQVISIDLNKASYKAVVTLQIDDNENNIPIDSQASIVTAGLLGANYISLTPGFEDTFLKNGDQIEDTHPAILLEEMIGQLMFSMKNDNADADKEAVQ
ncbi:MAG: outer membrane lipid asymmetry maintenance protein MlaD [Legionellales bacterium]|nr:outer membrane lipid asymmetry maintenance protein MlaD [Legionellales bacterium]